jgi:hypothetical protein
MVRRRSGVIRGEADPDSQQPAVGSAILSDHFVVTHCDFKTNMNRVVLRRHDRAENDGRGDTRLVVMRTMVE